MMRKKLPMAGDTTPWKTQFAWLPTEVEGHRIWWEHYEVRKVFYEGIMYNKFGAARWDLDWRYEFRLKNE